ncbi:MAG: hypothetical protein ACJ748_01695 [Flavisolibacter sp.]
MKLFLLYILFMCGTWMASHFNGHQQTISSAKVIKQTKESIPFEMVPANIFIQYNQ